MPNIDWTEYMKQHHIKLRGDPNDDQPDEVHDSGGISGSEVETKSSNDAGQSSSRGV